MAKMVKEKRERFFCKCGGEVAMFNGTTGGKFKPFARCKKCGREARKPREMA